MRAPYMDGIRRVPFTCIAGLLGLGFAFLSMPEGFAQAPDGHTEHHPVPPEISAAPGQPPPSTSAGDIGHQPPVSASPPAAMGLGGMGEMMGVRPPKEFYPSLMDLPTLSAEERQAIEARMRARINSGIDEIAAAEPALRHAYASGDVSSAELAARRLREGLNQVRSGTAALRALTEGKAPSQIARAWFKEQMNLSPDSHPSTLAGPLGFSWFHVVSMALVAAFSVVMAAIYFARMRRANALVARLTRVAPILSAAEPMPALPSAAEASAPQQKDPLATLVRTGLWKGQLRVAAIFRETPTVKTYRLREPEGGPIPFSFVPGQFLTFSAEIDGKLVRRSYTIASSAAQTSYVEATIKREDSGIFSDYMHDKVVEDDLLDVMGPSGAFTFRGVEADSVVLIGGGVGITPLMAAVRYLSDIAWPGEIFFVYGARSPEDFIFREELEYLQRRHLNLHVAATMARATSTSWTGPVGPITGELLSQAVPEIGKRHVHLCGPPGMMTAIRTILAELGVPNERIKTEAFGPAHGAVPPPGVTMVVPARSAAAAGDAAPQVSPIAAAAIGPATASIRFARSNKTAPLPPDKTVLEVAESIGVPIDYACRDGTCGICKMQLLEGKVTMEVEDALSPEDKARNIILACQAKSIGNLVVEA